MANEVLEDQVSAQVVRIVSAEDLKYLASSRGAGEDYSALPVNICVLEVLVVVRLVVDAVTAAVLIPVVNKVPYKIKKWKVD